MISAGGKLVVLQLQACCSPAIINGAIVCGQGMFPGTFAEMLRISGQWAHGALWAVHGAWQAMPAAGLAASLCADVSLHCSSAAAFDLLPLSRSLSSGTVNMKTEKGRRNADPGECILTQCNLSHNLPTPAGSLAQKPNVNPGLWFHLGAIRAGDGAAMPARAPHIPAQTAAPGDLGELQSKQRSKPVRGERLGTCLP